MEFGGHVIGIYVLGGQASSPGECMLHFIALPGMGFSSEKFTIGQFGQVQSGQPDGQSSVAVCQAKKIHNQSVCRN